MHQKIAKSYFIMETDSIFVFNKYIFHSKYTIYNKYLFLCNMFYIYCIFDKYYLLLFYFTHNLNNMNK